MKALFNPERLRDSGVLEKWHDKTYSNFTNDPDTLKKVQAYQKNIRKALKDGTGLFLYGAYGVGKTLLANILTIELLKAGYRCRVITLATLVSSFAAGWYDQEEAKSFLRMLQQVHFLVIDDLGKEFKGSSDLGLKVFDNVLRYRLQSNMPIIFTSNLTPTEIKEYYSEGVASMLQEMCAMIKVYGEDCRKDIGAKNKNILK